MVKAYTIRILVEDGDPEGVRTFERSNWTGRGIAFPRDRWADVRTRQEFGGPGVYLLVNLGADPARPTLYVVMTDEVRARLDSHSRLKPDWTFGVAVTSLNDGLNAANARWLEHELIAIARRVDRCELENANGGSAPKLSLHELADMRSFLSCMLEM